MSAQATLGASICGTFSRFSKQVGDIGVLGRSSTVLIMADPRVSPLSTATLLTTWCQQPMAADASAIRIEG
jgi:hypothetical protein